MAILLFAAVVGIGLGVAAAVMKNVAFTLASAFGPVGILALWDEAVQRTQTPCQANAGILDPSYCDRLTTAFFVFSSLFAISWSVTYLWRDSQVES